jgi:crotonobetainyl-CoA:carnitine CoA-transferase CaiB-like acyl-CoA transferase
LEVGAHTREVLAEVGYGDGQIRELVADGVVHAPH